MKPQVLAAHRVELRVIQKLTLWLRQFDLAGNERSHLASLVVAEAKANWINSIAPSAPQVYLPDKEWMEHLFVESQKLCIKWDE